MEDSKSSVKEHPEDELKDATRFGQSLQELKDLRSQLHHAADYCEAIFLNAKQKQEVVENTKEYVCRAIVTVVDHLGSVSANLEYEFSKTNTVSDAELRINCLKQETRKLRRHMLHWKSMQNNDFVSLFRRSKRMT
ncbi:hypothetical protein LguiA_019981 [Lonicera macranthoides]